MTSFKQFEANRRNARMSTGPTSEEGKQRSRCNAVRHGLTAETVIGALEDAEDYKAFEAAIISDYDAQSAVERELVLRLASLLWRLRRATAIETGLFESQANQRGGLNRQVSSSSREVVCTLFGRDDSGSVDADTKSHDGACGLGDVPVKTTLHPGSELALCFLRLADMPNYAIDRLCRYEATLWRQTAQILFALDVLGRRKPWDRRRHLGFGSR